MRSDVSVFGNLQKQWKKWVSMHIYSKNKADGLCCHIMYFSYTLTPVNQDVVRMTTHKCFFFPRHSLCLCH